MLVQARIFVREITPGLLLGRHKLRSNRLFCANDERSIVRQEIGMTRSASPPTIDLDRLVASGQLPALPQSAIRILEIAKNPENGPAEFSPAIDADPGLTSQVLRFVNSSYFGFSREITSVKQALTLVGTRTVKNFTLWSAVFSLMPNPRCGMFDLRSLWQDSLRRGLFARLVARALKAKEAEEAFAAALLQDMAVPLLTKEFVNDYAQLLSLRQSGKIRLSQLEQRQFGWTHAQAGAKVARHWNLPEELASAIEHHTELESLLRTGRQEPVRLAVSLSALLPATIDGVWHDHHEFDHHFAAILPASHQVSDALEQVDSDFQEFGPVLKLASPGKSLVQLYCEAKQIGTANG